jgi:hypothetical protein
MTHTSGRRKDLEFSDVINFISADACRNCRKTKKYPK